MGSRRDPTGDDNFHQDRLCEALIRHFRMRLGLLPPLEVKILADYFGIDRGRSYTFEEIGQRFGLTRERVEEIVKRAVARLRDTSAESDWGGRRWPGSLSNKLQMNELDEIMESQMGDQTASHLRLLAEEKEILRLSFGIAREIVNSIEGMAMRLKLPSTQARRMRRQAILKLRLWWRDRPEGGRLDINGPVSGHPRAKEF